MTFRHCLAATFVAVWLSACTTAPHIETRMTDAEIERFEVQSVSKYILAGDKVAAMTDEEVGEALADALTDLTSIVHQQGHGIYVEYTAPDGLLFQWYPQNASLVRGTWGISRGSSPPRACFRYQGSYHGVTGEFEPNECVPAVQVLSDAFVLDERKGDPFGLSTKGIPYMKSADDLPRWPGTPASNTAE